MTAAYIRAAMPAPWQILGLRLRPFSLGHYFHLARFNSPFVAEEAGNAGYADLILGALICSMRFEEFSDFLMQDDIATPVAEWGKACRDFNVPEKIALFAKYVAEAWTVPTVVFEPETRESGANWAQALYSVLTGGMGYSPEEAMNAPLGQALHDFYMDAERRGVLQIADPGLAELLNADLDAPQNPFEPCTPGVSPAAHPLDMMES